MEDIIYLVLCNYGGVRPSDNFTTEDREDAFSMYASYSNLERFSIDDLLRIPFFVVELYAIPCDKDGIFIADEHGSFDSYLLKKQFFDLWLIYPKESLL